MNQINQMNQYMILNANDCGKCKGATNVGNVMMNDHVVSERINENVVG